MLHHVPMSIYLVKLNGWPDTFNERVAAIADGVDSVTVIRPRPADESGDLDDMENVSVWNLYPRRGPAINDLWLHLIVFPVYILQATFLAVALAIYRRERPSAVHGLDYIVNGCTAMCIATVLSSPLVVSVRGLAKPRYGAMVRENDALVGTFNYKVVVLLASVVLKRSEIVRERRLEDVS